MAGDICFNFNSIDFIKSFLSQRSKRGKKINGALRLGFVATGSVARRFFSAERLNYFERSDSISFLSPISHER
jgi:hypothetical protein